MGQLAEQQRVPAQTRAGDRHAAYLGSSGVMILAIRLCGTLAPDR